MEKIGNFLYQRNSYNIHHKTDVRVSMGVFTHLKFSFFLHTTSYKISRILWTVPNYLHGSMESEITSFVPQSNITSCQFRVGGVVGGLVPSQDVVVTNHSTRIQHRSREVEVYISVRVEVVTLMGDLYFGCLLACGI